MPAGPRLHCPAPLQPGALVSLPAGAARHAQVLRLQPGDALTLFGGEGVGGEYAATVVLMGRSEVQVRVGEHHAVERETRHMVHLAVGMPANERMDWLVEKATELGVASIQPLMTERSVVRLDGPRAEKKAAHWSSIAIAACEQCGRNRVPAVHAPRTLAAWTKALRDAPVMNATSATTALVLSLRPDARPLREPALQVPPPAGASFTLLSGPEGGLSDAEEALAGELGFLPVSLGARVLRAETAALAALTLLA